MAQMSPMSPMKTGVEVILNSTPTLSDSKKPSQKRPSCARNWFFTWNNYPTRLVSDVSSNLDEIAEEWLVLLLTVFKKRCEAWVFQKELGTTPHIQGCITCKVKDRWSDFGLPKDIHWELTKNNARAQEYCCKDNTRVGDSWWVFPEPEEVIVYARDTLQTLYPWQQWVFNNCKDKADHRTINWVFDPIGNNGKTFFMKHMFDTVGALCTDGGQQKDITCYIASTQETKKGQIAKDLNKPGTTFIFDLARCCEKISYHSLEAVKNGFVFSPKYGSKSYSFNCPHVWVFSNELPDCSKMSADRWKLYTIDKSKHLVEITIDDNNDIVTRCPLIKNPEIDDKFILKF